MFLAIICLGLCACQPPEIYSAYHAIDSKGWAIDSAQDFTFDINDTAATYQMLIYVRHNECYPYQNMWLIVDDTARHQCPLDTIDFYLANNRGQWLGNNHTGFIEMPVLYISERRFATPGTYHIALQHAMRDSLLTGVLDMGLTIKKNGKK